MEKAIFFPYDVLVQDNFRGRGYTEIHFWSFDRESNNCLIRVPSYYPNAYLELPNLDGVIWTPELANNIVLYLRKRIDEDFVMAEFVMKRPIYYYNEDPIPFLHLFFRTQESLRKCKRMFSNPINIPKLGDIEKINMWEVDIATDLKLITEVECEYSSWTEADGQKIEFDSDDRVSIRGTLEYIVIDWKTMKKLPYYWPVTPRKLSIDIETYSDNHRALPNPLEAAHDITMISCIFEEKEIKKYAIVVGICDDIPGAEIILVKDEIELIKRFSDLVILLNPNIIMGYNIYTYDYPYLNTRFKSRLNDWKSMGMLLDSPTELKGREWSSRALKGNNIKYLHMEGRLSIDIFPMIKRDYKLSKYSLDFVSRHFLNRGKHDVKPIEMFIIYERMKDAIRSNDPNKIKASKAEVAKVVSYCLEDSILVNDLFNELKIWPNLIAFSSTMCIPMIHVITQGQQIRCLSQLYGVASKNNYVLTRRMDSNLVAAGGYVGEPTPTIHDNIIVVDFASMYPSIILAYNLCYTTLLKEKPKEEPYEVKKLREKGLLKKSGDKMETNESDWYATFICEQEEENDFSEEVEDPTPGYEEEEEEEEKAATIIRTYQHRFVKKEVRLGLVPILVKNLVDKRAEVKLLLKDNTRKDLIQLKSKELALKVSANSIYGVTGLKNGIIALMEMTMTVTSVGRNLIKEVNSYCETKYNAKIVYNDTDSSMIDFDIKDPSECFAMGKKIEEEISGSKDRPGLFPPPLRVEFEKAVRLFTIKKKKYAYYLIQKDGTIKKTEDRPELGVKGIILARRDNPPFLRKVYEDVLRNIMEQNSLKSSLDLVLGAILSLLRREVSLKDLEIIRQLGSNYKNPNSFMNVFASELAKQGHPAKPGDNLGYVIIRNNSELLGERMRLIELFEEQTKSRLSIKVKKNYDQIDYLYYLNNILANPIDQLISFGYARELASMNKGYQPLSKQCKIRPLSHPVKMVGKYISDRLKDTDPSCQEQYLEIIANEIPQLLSI